MQDLGVSAVELLPVFAFDEQDGPPGLGNYWEGPTDPEVEPLRNRQVKNFLTLILLATGTPMLLMGDEVRCSRGGNNNAYCQNNEISWFGWTLIEKNGDVLRFVKDLMALRMNRDLPVEQLNRGYAGAAFRKRPPS